MNTSGPEYAWVKKVADKLNYWWWKLIYSWRNPPAKILDIGNLNDEYVKEWMEEYKKLLLKR